MYLATLYFYIVPMRQLRSTLCNHVSRCLAALITRDAGCIALIDVNSRIVVAFSALQVCIIQYDRNGMSRSFTVPFVKTNMLFASPRNTLWKIRSPLSRDSLFLRSTAYASQSPNLIGFFICITFNKRYQVSLYYKLYDLIIMTLSNSMNTLYSSRIVDEHELSFYYSTAIMCTIY